MSYSVEQLVHDEINLKGLVRKLEKSVSDPFWDQSPEENAWIKAQGTLQVSILYIYIYYIAVDVSFLGRR